MAIVSNCNVPEDLFYWVEKHVWARVAGDLIEVGITDAAQTLAGKVLVCRIKKPGRALKRGSSGASLESGKWVGGVSTPVSGILEETNGEAESSPEILNQAPYQSWLFRIRPDNWDQDKALLVTGQAAVDAYREKIAADNIPCQGKT
ncbi:MAG: glycine cleavage system protein H [Thermaerobacter sp.]|nr:glycine cleavage system protein H [Thermaerobacter sp.]